MYNSTLLLTRMAELGLNYPKLAAEAKIDPKTAKKVVETGKGHPDKVIAVARVLKFKLPEIVLRPVTTNGKRRA